MAPTTSNYEFLISLVKGSDKDWTVVVGGLPKFFSSIENASDYLVDKLAVKDDEVDVALCHMYGNGHSRCLFSERGDFVRTEMK